MSVMQFSVMNITKQATAEKRDICELKLITILRIFLKLDHSEPEKERVL